MWEAIQASFVRAPWGWGLLGSFIAGWLTIYPKVRRMQIDEHSQMRQEYVDQIKELRKEVQELRVELGNVVRENNELRVQLAGSRRQALSEQAAMIRNIPAVREAVQEAASGKAK